jgi:hypothetical protein
MTIAKRPSWRGGTRGAKHIFLKNGSVIFKCRLLVEEGRKIGHTFSQPDLIVAATALHHGLTLVSRDVHDFEKAHVPVLNPWNDPAPAGA